MYMAQCKNCRFFNSLMFECRRYAPRPSQYPQQKWLDYHNSELLRDIAWTLRMGHSIEKPDKDDDLCTMATEVIDDDRWPTVDKEDWCGEFEEKKHAESS